ncbi:MAG: ABC transporter substrate-binding protein [Flavobacteriaceae bacterium]
MRKAIVLIFLVILSGCQRQKKPQLPVGEVSPIDRVSIDHATGFSIEVHSPDLTVIRVNAPWPQAEKGFSYALVNRHAMGQVTLPRDAYDAIVPVPVQKMVVTSTTHIAALEALEALEVLTGFPNTDYISSQKARALIKQGHIVDLGSNESLNTEKTLELAPEVVMGFGIGGNTKAYETLQRAQIPVVYNGDWVEHSPLGKAEWIKFFAPFFKKEAMAKTLFSHVETAYGQAKGKAQMAKERPTVLTGGLFKDVWYVAGGNSWMARFLSDAGAQYLWADNQDTGGVALSLESVLAKAREADVWLNPSMHVSYQELADTNPHYTQFKAYKTQKIHTNSLAKGETGGLLFYEQAPLRPDWVLQDLIHILHPDLLPDHQPVFFKPLE